ncbi:hypothetical protein D9623_19955 [Azospirillum brasilense]|uniref:Flagellar hook-length control protein FliK n=1 Tax=Azospirillum brasilense TaxID=192 RepID=A0A4D8QQE5_AZOBR|nr:hypothetical protein D3868_17790 [Azospirillum brasilense]QEL92819.1 hypothetical protein D9621_19710 [Azospirillum brasilense]QEL99134.1 hypothetical protein D9623_19955 [Azospirillum brasilense]
MVAEGTVKALPERLQDIARPVVLTGTVVGTTPEGLARVRTQAGEVLVQTPTPLPADKPVTLQITPAQVLLEQAQAASTDPAAASPALSLAAKVLVLTQGTPSTAAPGVPTLPTAGGPTPAIPGQTGATSTQGSAPQGSATPVVILPSPASTTPTVGPAGQPLPLLLPGTIVPALVIAAAPKPPAPPGAASALPGQPTAIPAPAPSLPVTDGGSGQAPTPTQADQPNTTPVPPQAPSTPSGPSPLPGKPMLDTTVELGGDAAHPGGDLPEPAPTKPPPAKPAGEPVLTQGGTVALKILTVTPPPDQPQAVPPDDGSPPPDGQSAGNPPRKDGAPPQPAFQSPAAPQPAPASPRGTATPTAAPTMPGADPGSSPATPETPDGLVLRGTVAGSTSQGQPILATPQGMLALNVQASLPQGSAVTAVLTDPAKALQTAPPPLATEPGPLSERDWPAMRQLLSALAGVDRSAAQTLIGTVMPQPNRKLGAAMSFFLSAIRGGDARGWLGEDAASALEKSGQGSLLSQLEREFRSLQQQAGDPLPGDWRPYTLPMMDANGLLPIKLHIHPINSEEDGKTGRKGGDKGSRFLLDLDLSRLGPMQLDGLVQPNRFDLILRSHTPLEPEIRLDLIQIFADSIRAVGYIGGLSFQSGAKCWVKLTRVGAGGSSYTA